MILRKTARRSARGRISSHRSIGSAIAKARPQVRFESLENRVLLSAVPSAGTTTMIDHSTGFADTSDLRFNGSAGLPAIASVTDSQGNSYSDVLQLADGKAGEYSSAFTDPPPDGTGQVQGVDTFDTTFDFTFGTAVPPVADGFTFTLQNDPAKAMALGFPGGSLGYQNIKNSIGIKFDLYPNVTSTGVYVGGVLPADTPVRAVNATVPAPTDTSIDLTKNPDGSATLLDFHANPSDVYRVHLVYDGTTLTETFSDVTKSISVSQQYAVNIPAAVNGHTAYVGFTSASGKGSEQDIINWKFTGTQASTGLVPLPAPVLYATACQPGQTMLAWSNVTGNETGFEIDRSTDGTNFVLATKVPAGATTYMDTGLDSTKTYSYRLKALGDNTTNSDSAFSNVVSASAAGLTPLAISHSGGFAGETDLMLNGTAKVLSGNGALQLSSGTADAEDGTAFDTNAQLVKQFDTSFDFTFGTTTPPNADGFTFTLQAGAPTEKGGDGGGLGYVNIPASIAIKFDLYDAASPTPTTYNATGVYANGANPDDDPRQGVDPTAPVVIMAGAGGTNGPSIDLKTDAKGHPTGIDFHANPGDTYHVHLVYDGTTLTETVSDATKNVTVSQAYTIDIPGTIGAPCALVGFTGASGGERSEQDILNWTFTSGNTKPTRLPADFNNDGKVDFSDLLILAQHYGKTGQTQDTGDTNGDGKVDFSDLLTLAQEYGKTSTGAATLASTLLSRQQRHRK